MRERTSITRREDSVSFDAKVVKVLIDSPGDVADECHLARQVILDWNAVNAEDRHLVLLPVAWATNSSPDLSGRPQGIINDQILRGCDLLVAIFWTRIGTPTGVASSGTVEEIQEHRREGKRVMLYFSSAPVRPDSVDPDQYAALQEFKRSCRDQGLFEQFEGISDFRDKFSRHLAQTVIQMFPGAASSDRPAVAAPAQQVSEDAGNLLLLATEGGGHIILANAIGGATVQVGGRVLTEPGNARVEARWRSAINELEDKGLIEDRSGKGEMFFVTDSGYRTSDLITKRRTP